MPANRYAVVAIPAHNEEERIGSCLAALGIQRDQLGSPIPPGSFEILVYANNCTDFTASHAAAYSRTIPHPLTIISETLTASESSAGAARKRAMELAAARVAGVAPDGGVILTTDADTRVTPTWIARNLTEIAKGNDCVAGYIDADPLEFVDLGAEFCRRGQLEDTYLRAIAEIHALCDPRPHDPWPNHRVSSGASLAVTLAAYLAIGGLPQRHVGEDSALTEALDRAGYKVRHSLDVCVSTSCRLDGRAMGGAADTMRARHRDTNAFCDEDLEPALPLTRRALYKGFLRRRWYQEAPASAKWPMRLGIEPPPAPRSAPRDVGFEDFWRTICASSPTLRSRIRLRPSDLPRQIARAAMILRIIRSPVNSKVARGDRPHLEQPFERAAS